MVHGKLAPGHPLRGCAVAVASLLAASVMSFSARAEHGDDVAPPETTPPAELDFLFSPPRFSVGIRGGWAINRSDGEIFDFLTETLTLDRSAFDGFAAAIDCSWQLMPWLDIAVGLELNNRTTSSKFRGFVDEFGDPAEQETSFTQLPLTLSVKLFPFDRGRRVGQYAWIPAAFVPYFGGGVGATWYQLKQTGEFVDSEEMEVFEDVFTSEGWAFAGHAFVGFEVKFTKRVGLVLEGRYYWASAEIGGSFKGFAPIDLNGARAMAGFNYKF